MKFGLKAGTKKSNCIQSWLNLGQKSQIVFKVDEIWVKSWHQKIPLYIFSKFKKFEETKIGVIS